jgi:hypothetical protein
MICATRRRARVAQAALNEYGDTVKAAREVIDGADIAYVTVRGIPWYGPWWTWLAIRASVRALLQGEEFRQLESQLQDIEAGYVTTPDGFAIMRSAR